MQYRCQKCQKLGHNSRTCERGPDFKRRRSPLKGTSRVRLSDDERKAHKQASKRRYETSEKARAYRETHKEQKRIYQRRYRERHPERVKATRRRWTTNNPYKTRDSERLRWAQPLRRAKDLVQAAKGRSIKQNLPFSLTLSRVEQALSVGVCEVTGIPFHMAYKGGQRSPWAPSVDRIDPAKGYTDSNVQVVVWSLNAAKGNWLMNDVLRLAKALVGGEPS